MKGLARSVRQVDVWRIAAEAHRDPRTVLTVLQGGGSRLTWSAVIDAAKKLGIVLPTELIENPPTRVRAT